MNNRIYNIVYSKLTQWLTPAMLRKPNMTSWLSVCISPIIYVYNNLLRFRTLKLYQLSITPQVFSLQKLLNDQYDYFQRRIRIVDSVFADPLYIYRESESKPRYLRRSSESAPLIIYTNGEASELKDDFIVIVPYGISFNTDEMASLIRQYKLGSKQFKIQQQ